MKLAPALLALAGGADAKLRRGSPRTAAAPRARTPEDAALDAALAAVAAAAEDAAAADLHNRSARHLQGGCTETPAWHPTPVTDVPWADGYCQFTRDCDQPGYSTQLACCTTHFGGQSSGYCLSTLPNPPTGSPTGPEGGGDAGWYPNYGAAWPVRGCDFGTPESLNFQGNVGDRSDTQLECCKTYVANQESGFCLSELPNPPTGAPTGPDGGGAAGWFPDYDTAWSVAGCEFGTPEALGFGPGDRPKSDTQLECCNQWYGGQVSGACIAGLPEPPTGAPTGEGDLLWFPDYDTAWTEAGCIGPAKLESIGLGPGDRPTFATQLECCKGAYNNQVSGACIAGLPNPPTGAPTGPDGGGSTGWYPDYGTAWTVAGCEFGNPESLGFIEGYRPKADTQLECCQKYYANQESGTCLAGLPNPPTGAPSGPDAPGAAGWYPDAGAWDVRICEFGTPESLDFIDGSRGPKSDTGEECCNTYVGYQPADACRCNLDPCYSCNCPGIGDGSGCTPALVCNP